ncbi:hypothetical protein T459_26958 [Capsicum annuum]|uniref:F-box domain-containing protein n=1 Tax=Capsicum annuum TaxID=4072 RepID=A0A2G2YD38_CAPAN|nr:hypothetical protein T459_26958 [Capsicum annuum]
MLSEVTIMDLLRVIMVEILARLPIKSIFRCKIVCKSWYHLLTSNPLFVKNYQKRSSSFPSILLSVNDSVRFIVELKDENDSQSLYRNIELRPMIHLPSTNKENLTLVGSCNGFMCLLNGWRNNVDNSVYISNHLLSEYFKVELPEWEKSFWNIVYGFGFSEASGQYKVLRFKLAAKNFLGRPKASDLEVYTLGVDEKWRNAGEVPEPLWRSFNNVNVNGAVHWMDCEKNDIIYSFNISTEEVNSLNGQSIDIWWMKEYGIAESWTKNLILKDGIQLDIRDDRFIPILIWKDGEILMQRDRGTQLVSYNPKEKKFKKVKVYNGFGATGYIPSFYSLNTVMGDSFQVSNVYPKTEIV